MYKAKRRRMQRLPGKSLSPEKVPVRFLRPAIGRIAEQRMADRRHVHAHLMCAAGLQLALHQRGIPQFFQPFIMRNGMLAFGIGNDRHFLAIVARSANVATHSSACGPGMALDDRAIFSSDSVIRKLLGQADVRRIAFGRDEQTRCILVDAVDDAGPCDAADARQLPLAVVQ